MFAWLSPCCCQEQPAGNDQVVFAAATDEASGVVRPASPWGPEAGAVPPCRTEGPPGGGQDLRGSAGGAAHGRICVGDDVRVTADEQALRRAFESSPKRWDDSMRRVLGTVQKVLAASEDGRLVGLREAEAGSGEPVWFYPASCLSLDVRSQAPPCSDKKAEDAGARWGDARPTAASPSQSTSGGEAADTADAESEHGERASEGGCGVPAREGELEDQDAPEYPGPGSARSLTAEERYREKLRLQSLVNGFARRAVKGCPCTYLKASWEDPEKYQAFATQYRLDRGLENLTVLSGEDPSLAVVACPIAAIKDIYSLREDDEACFPSGVVCSLQPQDRDLLLMVVIQRNDMTLKFCILEESIEARDEFLETLRILCIYTQSSPAR